MTPLKATVALSGVFLCFLWLLPVEGDQHLKCSTFLIIVNNLVKIK